MSTSDLAISGEGHRWTARAGGWLAIGTGPGALVFGAEIAHRHDGPAPLTIVAAGVLIMAVLLSVQGMLGLVRPVGEHATLSGLAPRYLHRGAHLTLNGLLALAMIGWFGFNVGLGGAAASALLGVPGPAGPLLLAAPIIVFSLGGMRRWNPLAIVTTCSAVVLVGVVASHMAVPTSPVTPEFGGLSAGAADIAAFIGFVSVFSLRAPDFSVGLASRRDLAVCVGLLVVPAVFIMLAGVGMHLGTGSADLVGVLSDGDLAVGNLLVAISVIAPAFTTTYSGSLALRTFMPFSSRTLMLAILVPGLVLAVARFDRHLLTWLTVLAAVLPMLLVPMAVEGARRRRGGAPRRVPLWTFVPAAGLALVLTASGVSLAPLVGLAAAGIATVAWLRMA